MAAKTGLERLAEFLGGELIRAGNNNWYATIKDDEYQLLYILDPFNDLNQAAMLEAKIREIGKEEQYLRELWHIIQKDNSIAHWRLWKWWETSFNQITANADQRAKAVLRVIGNA